MTIHCFVLTKISSSYSYVCSHEVEDGATVDNVSQAAGESASKFHSRNPETTHVVIKLYQVLLNPMFCSRLQACTDVSAAHSAARG